MYLDNNKIGNNGFIEIINSLFDFSRVPFFGHKAFRGETLRILSFHENITEEYLNKEYDRIKQSSYNFNKLYTDYWDKEFDKYNLSL